MAKLGAYNCLLAESRILDEKLSAINKEIAKYDNEKQNLVKLERELQQKEQKLEILKKQLSLSSSGQILEKFNEAQQQLKMAENDVIEQEIVIKSAQSECDHYVKESSELSRDRDGKLSKIKVWCQVDFYYNIVLV